MDNTPVKFDISIIIPARNEEKRLPVFLDQLADYCHKNEKIRYEIIVVDDGSSDQTSFVTQGFMKKLPGLRASRLNKNRGKGYAVKTGFGLAQGDIVLFMDADGSTSLTEIENNLGFLKEGYDIVIGSRAMKSYLTWINARWHRRAMGKVFNFLVHQMLLKDIEDTQCGFKMFKKEVIEPIFSKVIIDGFGFDLEVLYLASRMGYRIKEVPVHWAHCGGSKVNLLFDSCRMLFNIIEIRFRHRNVDKIWKAKKEIALNL